MKGVNYVKFPILFREFLIYGERKRGRRRGVGGGVRGREGGVGVGVGGGGGR